MLIAVSSLAGFLLGGVFVYGFFARRLSSAAAELARQTERAAQLEAALSAERSSNEKLRGDFKLAAVDALRSVSEDFTKAAVKDMRLVSQENDRAIGDNKKEIASSVADMKARLEEYQRVVKKFEEERVGMYARLEQTLAQVLSAEQTMASEARSLKRVLTASSGVRGTWGERVLRNILEQSDFVLGVDFEMQTSLSRETENDSRPDFVINLPGGRRLAVDSKEVTGEYALAQEADDPERRGEHLRKLVANIRSNFVRLGRKEYQASLDSDVPFVIMFIPSEPAIRAAFETDPQIFQDAVDKKVVLASPMTIIPLIYLIRHSWQQERLAENARELGAIVEELGNRLTTFVGYVKNMRDGIQRSADSWDKAMGSWEKRVAPQIERVRQFGGKLKETEELAPIETKLKALSASSEEAPAS